MNETFRAILRSMKILRRFYPAIRLLSLGVFIGIVWQTLEGERRDMRKRMEVLEAAFTSQAKETKEDHDIIIRMDTTLKSVDHRLGRLEKN